MKSNLINAACVAALGILFAAVVTMPEEAKGEELVLEADSVYAGVTAEISVKLPEVEPVVIEPVIEEPKIEPVTEVYIDPVDDYSAKDLDWLYRTVQAEAGNQDEMGMRYVAAVILNRVESDGFPDTIFEVISQKINGRNQWATYPTAINAQIVRDDVIENVKAEIRDRSNREILFFRTKHYHNFGTPCFKHGAHYFSTE